MIKKRILEYINCKGITLHLFFKETGIKRGFLDTDKLDRSVSDTNIVAILNAYPDIDLNWLLTGKGDMIINKTYLQSIPQKPKIVAEDSLEYKTNQAYLELLEESNKIKGEMIELLQEINRVCKENNELKEKVKALGLVATTQKVT